MKAFTIKQGDAYSIPLTITADGAVLDDTSAALVEVMLGHHLRKTWPGDIEWDGGASCWLLPVTQAESFAMTPETELPLDVRVKTADGAVLGTVEAMRLRVAPAQSRTVI